MDLSPVPAQRVARAPRAAADARASSASCSAGEKKTRMPVVGGGGSGSSFTTYLPRARRDTWERGARQPCVWGASDDCVVCGVSCIVGALVRY